MKYQHGLAFPDADVFMAAQLGSDGRYQGDHLDAALRHVSDFSVALDGGAHVGTWSRGLAARFDRVIAVEPCPDTFEALTVNVRGCANVDTLNVALGSTAGRVSIVIDPDNAARQNTGARYVQPGDAVAMVTIDSLELSTLGFIKLDVEGSEYPALFGARETIRRCRPVVLFEEKGFGSRFGGARGQCAVFLRTLGYLPIASISADQIWGPR